MIMDKLADSVFEFNRDRLIKYNNNQKKLWEEMDQLGFYFTSLFPGSDASAVWTKVAKAWF